MWIVSWRQAHDTLVKIVDRQERKYPVQLLEYDSDESKLRSKGICEKEIVLSILICTKQDLMNLHCNILNSIAKKSILHNFTSDAFY